MPEALEDWPAFETQEQISLDTEIEKLRDLEGVLSSMQIALLQPNEDLPLAEKMLGWIKKGRAGELKGLDKATEIKTALAAGSIKEQDITDRINNMDADLKDLEQKLPAVENNNQAIDLAQAVHDKYFPHGKDWPS